MIEKAELIRIDKLRTLADHLMVGKLGHKRFDFTAYNNGVIGHDGIYNHCGTNGCALGECPIIFANEGWKFKHNLVSLKIDRQEHYNGDAAQEFFKIEQTALINHLFYPNMQDTSMGEILGKGATKEQVASNIYKFIKLVEEQLKTIE